MENGENEVTRTTRTVVSRTYESSGGGGGGQESMSRAYESSGGGQNMSRTYESSIGGGQVTDIASSMALGDGGALSLGMGGGVYDLSNTMVSDITLSSSGSIGAGGAYSGTGVTLDRDLSSFKKRIDANTEEQREHADMMAGLQRKVEEYRRRIGGIENQISTGRAEERVTFNIKEMSGDWVPDVNVVSNQYEFSGQLEEERRRNEELCMSISQLQAEIQRMHQQYELNLHDKEKMSVTRERNLAQYLSEEQKKMMDLWAELQQVRRQFSEYKDQTARDLKVQRDEFTRVTRNVGGVVRKLSITNLGESQGSDSELVDAIRRFSEQQTLPGGTSTEDYNALMKKYEESIERIVELESRGDGSVGKVSALENELRRTKDKLIECQEALHKIHETTKESKRTDVTKRTRSLSPGGTHEVPSEVVRSVRFAIRSRDNELQQLMRKLKNTEMQITEMVTRFESAEETCKRLERQLTDSKREINNQQKALDDATREVRRLEDRLRGADSEKNVAENARVKLEEEIRRLKLVIDQSAVDGERLMLEEAESQKRIIEEEYKIRIAELMRKIDTVQDDNKRLKGDLGGVKDKYRNLEIEYNTTVRKIDEKDVAIRHLEDLKGDLLKDLENQRARFDMVTSELDNLQTHYDTTSKNTVVIEMTVKELKQQRDEVTRQKDDLAHQLADVIHKMEIEIKKREDIEKQSLRHLSEVEKLKAEISEFESEIMLLRRHNDELDTQLSTSQAKISTLENSLSSAQKEIAKLNEINVKLQREKQDILNEQQKAEATVDSLKERVRKLEQEIEKYKIENKNLLDNEEKAKIAFKEATNKVYALERELHDAKVEIEELRRKLGQLDDANRERLEVALKTRPSESGVYETTTITEVRVKELADQHKMDVERIENDRDDLLRRLRLLEDELAEKQRIIERQQAENDDLRREYQAEIERLKAELINIETKLTSELEDERDQHIREVDALRATEEDLRNKITLLEKKLEDTLNREKRLQDEVIEWEGKYDALTKEVQKLHDDMETIRIDAEKEIQKWKTEAYTAQTEVKNLEATNDTLKSQLAAANDRVSSLNKTINEQAAKMRELSSTVRRLEEELADSKATIATLEGDLESALTRLRSVEEQYATAQANNNKLRVENDNLNRQIDLLKNTNAAHESEIERLKKKVVQLTDINKQQTVELEKLRTERDQLDKAYRDKARQVEQMTDVIKTLETKVDRMRQELQILNDKLTTVETERNNLTSQVTKLERELNLIRDQLKRKTDEFNVALEELSNAHRVSEDGRINAIQELETRKFEISDLRSRLDNAEQRLAALQQEYLNADRERDLLQDSLRRFQSVISRSVIPEGGMVDVQSIDVHVQKLLTRIDKLERERNDYRDTLGRMQRKAGESVHVNQSTTLYHSIEERIADVEEGKRSAEVKLASAKELLRSQEDALKKRDEERRTMRSKINAIELETRGKEAQIRHLNEMVKTLKVDLQTAQSESRTVRDREDKYEVRPLQGKIHDDSDERISMITSTFDLEREKLNETVKKLSTKLQSSESKCADLKDDADRLKKDISKYERIEVELRRSLEEQTRLAREGQRFRDQLTMAQSDLANANNRKQQLDSELMNVRSELRDQKQRYHDATSRIADLERQIQSSMSDKNRLNDKINELEKTVANQRNTENDLRHQLTTANAERKALQNELDDLRRRIGNFENEKRGTVQKVEELVRIRITLIKRIEILETEKRSAQALIDETASQREAIEKSLNALERENKELCRNCTHLQQQIAQLEMDNGDRLITLTNKQKQEHERFVQSVKTEKAQVERIIENRDRTQKNRIRQLEVQMSQMRDQMNSDRLRRRDTFVSDVNRLGTTTTSLALTSNVEAPVFPQTSSLDYVIGNRNAFSSYYTVPSGYSPASSDIYKASSQSISLGQPVDAESSRQTYTTSYHLSGFGSAAGGGSSNVASSAMASSAMGRAVELGDGEMSKQTSVTVRKTTTQYEE